MALKFPSATPTSEELLALVGLAGDAAGTVVIVSARDLASANPIDVAIVDATGAQITSFGGGTQYTEGDVDATITGTASLMEGAGNTLLPIQGTVADGLLVNLGANNDVTITGTVTVSATNLDIRDLSHTQDSVRIGDGTDLVLVTAAGALVVDGSGVTQPVSGTVTANQGTAGSADWRTDLRRGQTLLFAVIDVAAAGDNTIVAADVTRKIKVCQYTIVADAAVACRWKSGAGTNLSGAMSNAANGGEVSPFVPPAHGHLLETAVNQALVLNLGGAVGARGHLTYFLET